MGKTMRGFELIEKFINEHCSASVRGDIITFLRVQMDALVRENAGLKEQVFDQAVVLATRGKENHELASDNSILKQHLVVAAAEKEDLKAKVKGLEVEIKKSPGGQNNEKEGTERPVTMRARPGILGKMESY